MLYYENAGGCLPGPDGGLCIRPSVKAVLTAVSEKGAGQEEKSGKGG
ncbi:hypothetical protein CLOM621_05434 [Clostridium sp. M62/1]|nr:hypothetical protein CLOM621_05434 [Clostridium sp. M62/1]